MGHINISEIDVVRAWKDEEYWNSLSEEQKAQLPENPAGMIELTDEEINGVVGGTGWGNYFTITAECLCPSSLTGRCRCSLSGVADFVIESAYEKPNRLAIEETSILEP